MPNDDLTVGRCEALSDAQVERITLKDYIDRRIVTWNVKKRHAEMRISALLEARSRLVSEPDCAEAVQAALELLR